MPEKPVSEKSPLEKLSSGKLDSDPNKPIGTQIQEGTQAVVKGVKQEVTAARRPWYRSKKMTFVLLGVYAIQLALFGLLAWWVHIHPVLGIDVAITHEFQENQTPWLRTLMVAVSFIGNAIWLSTGLIVLAALIFWVVNLRLEALMIVVVSATSAILNVAIKYLVARPRPTKTLVDVFQTAGGQSFPSGHVMSYLAFWGLLFSFGIILFKGNRWWRIALLIVPALFVVLVGPSRIYLGDHWASDVLGAYLIGGVWLGLALFLYLNLKSRGVLTSKTVGWKALRRAFGHSS